MTSTKSSTRKCPGCKRLNFRDAYIYKLVSFLLSAQHNVECATGADTIRILVATDSHVGYEERDPIRKDDSWRSFDEVMQLAKTEDVGA